MKVCMQMPQKLEVNIFLMSAIFPSTLAKKVIGEKNIPGKPFPS